MNIGINIWEGSEQGALLAWSRNNFFLVNGVCDQAGRVAISIDWEVGKN